MAHTVHTTTAPAHPHPSTHPNNRPGRGFIVGILASIALVFWLIAMTTPLAMVDVPEAGRLKVDPWHACSRVNDATIELCRPNGHPDEECTQYRDMFRVEQAFLLLTGIMLIPLLAVAAIDFSHKLDAATPDLPFGLHTHGWTIFFAITVALMSLVAFALAFAIPREDACDNGSLRDQSNFSWGPSPFFSLLIFVLSLFMVGVALVLREDGTMKAKEEIMHRSQHEPFPVTNEPMVRPPVPTNQPVRHEAPAGATAGNGHGAVPATSHQTVQPAAA